LSITSYVVYDRFYIKFSKFTFLVSLTIHIFAVIDSLAFYLLITSSLFLFRPFSDLKKFILQISIVFNDPDLKIWNS